MIPSDVMRACNIELNQANSSKWSDFESKASPWRQFCTDEKQFSATTILKFIDENGIDTKAVLVERIKEFVGKISQDQSGEFNCFFPFRDTAKIKIKLVLGTKEDHEITNVVNKVYVYTGKEEFRESFTGLPLHQINEKAAQMSGSGQFYFYYVYPQCLLDTYELVHEIYRILHERINLIK